MEYVFGTITRNGEVLQRLTTKGTEHTNLKGFVTIVRKYPDNEITDTFQVVDHYKSVKDPEGNCYDFYIIKDHYRNEDKFTPQSGSISAKITANADRTEFLEDCIAEMAMVFYP